MLRNTVITYGSVAKFFHWLIFILIVGLYLVGLNMTDMPLGPDKLEIYKLHKATGATVLGLIVLRLFWRLINPRPRMPDSMSLIEKMAAEVGHCALYILMIITPLSGWLMSSAAGYPVSVFGFYTLPDLIAPDKEFFTLSRDLHEIFATTLIVLAALHMVAALYHHFYQHDNVLRRMLPFGRP
jgi:cytochrome b561